jgi:hypothetical protein
MPQIVPFEIGYPMRFLTLPMPNTSGRRKREAW